MRLLVLAVLLALSAGREVDTSISTQYAFPVLTDKFGTAISADKLLRTALT